MRIIGGIHRSRKILAPHDDTVTRPITDRVKQSLFDRLWALGLVTPEAESGGGGGGHVVDLFAGTGSLGLEALSRGSAHCLFVEKDRPARALLARNIEALGLGDQAAVVAMDALSATWLAALPRRPVRVIFCDPPYAITADAAGMAKVAALLATLAAAPDPGVMEPASLLMLRTQEHVQPPTVAGWTGPESHPYGSMTLHFYRFGESTTPATPCASNADPSEPKEPA
jgi:16S rRNA (guanine966-N2)-methyltransferase